MASSEAERTAHYILACLERQFPGRWLGGGRKRAADPSNVYDLFENFTFRSINRDSHLGLLGWLQNRYPLLLLDRIPQPEEMLAIQCEGRRYVTLLLDEEWQTRQIGRHSGAFEFLLHDLEHAHKFFGDSDIYIGQVKFFRKIHLSVQSGFFAAHLSDLQFKSDLHYLISDMNSHPLHLLKYLKAIVLNAELRRTKQNKIDLIAYWRELFSLWEMSQNETLAALSINLPEQETLSARKIVAEFFVPSQIPAPQEALCLQE